MARSFLLGFSRLIFYIMLHSCFGIPTQALVNINTLGYYQCHYANVQTSDGKDNQFTFSILKENKSV